MPLKFKRSQVERIIREELSLLVKELWEAENDKDKKKEPEVGGADSENDVEVPSKSTDNTAPTVGAEKQDSPPEGEEPKAGDENIPDEEVPVDDDPSDTELSQDVEDPADEEEPEGSDIAKEIEGRSVQSITVNPTSKMMPGAQEIVIQFEEIPHPLRILIGKSGMIKYHFKGSIHNEL